MSKQARRQPAQDGTLPGSKAADVPQSVTDKNPEIVTLRNTHTLDTLDILRKPPRLCQTAGDEDQSAEDRIAKKSAATQAPTITPLGTAMVDAYQANKEEVEERNSQEEWKSCLLRFARALKGHPELSSLKPAKVLGLVEAHLCSWTKGWAAKGSQPPYGRSSKGDNWLEWFGIERADARVEFVELWQKIRFVPGSGPLEQARDANRKCRLLLPDSARDIRPLDDPKLRSEKDYEFFVGLAGWLQVTLGDKDMGMSCRAVGLVMGVSPMTISRFTRWAIEDGYVRHVRQHAFRSSGRSLAAEYRFNTGMWPALGDKAQKGTTASFLAASERVSKQAAELRHEQELQSQQETKRREEAAQAEAERQQKAAAEEKAEERAKEEAGLRAWLAEHAPELPELVKRFQKQWPPDFKLYQVSAGGEDPTKNLSFAAELRNVVTSGKLSVEVAA